MLSTHARLAARQGQSGTPRHEYLQQLVNEYARSQHWLRKEEIVANLANFAYDPINYAALKRLRVMELFVEIIRMYGDEQLPRADTDLESVRCGNMERREGSAGVIRSKRLLVELAMGGICNCIPDPSLQIGFIESEGVAIVVRRVQAIGEDLNEHLAVSSSTADRERQQHEAQKSVFNTALSALTIVYFLLDSPAFLSVSSETTINHITRLGDHPNVRIANVAKAYLSRYQELLASVPSDS